MSGGVWINAHLKLRASASHAFRLPTYTDLYYHDPANLGSPNLRPERAWSYETGMQWTPAARVRADVAVFHRRERDGIDYVRTSATDIWRATNVDRLQFTGVEASVDARLSTAQTVSLRYTAIHGAQAAFTDLSRDTYSTTHRNRRSRNGAGVSRITCWPAPAWERLTAAGAILTRCGTSTARGANMPCGPSCNSPTSQRRITRKYPAS